MTEPAWVSVGSLGLLAVMMTGAIAWLVRSKLKGRRRARAVAALARKYSKTRPVEPESRHDQEGGDDADTIELVTVSDLIARNLAEGRAVRLNWEGSEPGSADTGDWPTGVLPRVPRHDDEAR